MSTGRVPIRVSLPELLIARFNSVDADRAQLLGNALALGLTDAARPPEAEVADSPDPEKRKAQAIRNLLHFFGRYWYLALTATRLQHEVNALETKLEALDSAQPEGSAADAGQRILTLPRLMEVGALPFHADLDRAGRLFVSDATSDPAATAIAFGSGLVLLRPLSDSGTTEDILHEIGSYWSGVATLQYRAYALGHDRQVLQFRLAAARSEAALKARLSIEPSPVRRRDG
ncbi:MAG: hypothetical protein ABI401_03590 [Candidatus Dormibacter sp.]